VGTREGRQRLAIDTMASCICHELLTAGTTAAFTGLPPSPILCKPLCNGRMISVPDCRRLRRRSGETQRSGCNKIQPPITAVGTSR
jgi:hypothetical protein